MEVPCSFCVASRLRRWVMVWTADGNVRGPFTWQDAGSKPLPRPAGGGRGHAGRHQSEPPVLWVRQHLVCFLSCCWTENSMHGLAQPKPSSLRCNPVRSTAAGPVGALAPPQSAVLLHSLAPWRSLSLEVLRDEFKETPLSRLALVLIRVHRWRTIR